MQLTKQIITDFLKACNEQLDNEQRRIIIKILESQIEMEDLWKELNQ